MNNVRKNYIFSLAYQILALIIPLATTPYLARILGAENIGIFSYTSAIVQYFVLAAMLGINDYGNRCIAASVNKQDRSKQFWSLYALQATTCILGIILFAIFISCFAKQHRTILLIQGITLLGAMLDINWFFWGREQFRLTVTRNILIKLLSLFAVFLFVRNNNDLWKYVLITTLSVFMNNMVLWFFLRKEVHHPHITYKSVSEHFLPCLILFIPLISRSIFVYLDKTMLGVLAGMTETGYYEYSEKIILAATSVLTALGTVMLPRIVNLLTIGDINTSRKYTSLSMEYVTCLGVALSFGMASIADFVALIFLGENYSACGSIIKIMSITIILVGWTNVIRTHYIIPCKKDKIYLCAVLLGAVIDFIINLLLIPQYGALGAAIGWVAAEIAITITQTIYAARQLPILQYMVNALGYLFCGTIMYMAVQALCKLFSYSAFSLCFIILCGMFVYIFLAFIYVKTLRKDLWHTLSEEFCLKRRKKDT